MHSRPFALAALTLAALLAVPVPAPAQSDESLTLIAGANQTGFFEILEYVAEAEGFFKEQHLHVDVQFANNPGNAAQLVASGKGDIVSTSLEPIIQGYEKGLRLTAFFNRNPQYQWVLAVLADSPIHTAADFKGTTLGEYTPRSPGEYSTDATLRGAGLKSSDYSYEVIGSGAQAIAALTGKKVAGASFPYAELLIYENVANLKFRYFWNPILKDISDVGFCATPTTIETKADALKRFTRAMAESSIFIRVNPQVAARDFLHGAGVQATPEALRNEVRLLQIGQGILPGVIPTSNKVGELGTRSANVLTKFINDNGLTAHVVPVSAVVTDRFIPYANDFDHRAFIERARSTH
jgi:NitT/TauT family transport system substrate-binding protein